MKTVPMAIALALVGLAFVGVALPTAEASGCTINAGSCNGGDCTVNAGTCTTGGSCYVNLSRCGN